MVEEIICFRLSIFCSLLFFNSIELCAYHYNRLFVCLYISQKYIYGQFRERERDENQSLIRKVE